MDYTLFINKFTGLRPVEVFKHSDFDLRDIPSFKGLFHRFADELFMAGQQYFSRTIALVEDLDGHVKKIRPNQFRFLDVKA